MSKLGDKIKHLRVLRGISMEGLAEEVGVSRASISKIESGDTLNPRMDTIAKIAEVLKIDQEYFTDINAVTPFELIQKMPPETQAFLMNEKTMPYLKLAISAWKEDIKIEDIEELIKFAKKFGKG